MKKFITLFSVLILVTTSSIYGLTATEVYEKAIVTNTKLFTANWPDKFTKKNTLFESILNIDSSDHDDIVNRHERMIHTAYLTDDQIVQMINRVEEFSENVPDLVPYIQDKINNLYHDENLTIQHISIYGSYLYNEIDPDDVDLMIVVDSKFTIFRHIELPATTILGSKGIYLPKISFQIIDYNTYLVAQNKIRKKSPVLSQGEKVALQQLTLAGGWNFCIFGFDFRYDLPNKLSENMKLNYLKNAFICLSKAGARLYKTPLSNLPPETDLVRLRKVVSRILITDYILTVLNKTDAEAEETYSSLYDEIRGIQNYEHEKMNIIAGKIENLYLKKLKQILLLAETNNKLDQLTSRKY
jgi:hypothetical protein